MKEENKTHWKQNFNYDYLGAYSLQEGQEVVLTINTVSKKMVMGSGGQKEECTVANFLEAVNGEKKPMILNKTNCKIISKLYGTPYIEDWKGKRVTIYVQPDIKAFGELVDALRIKQIIPNEKQELTPTHKKWDAVNERIKAGAKIEDIRKHYDITQENFDLCL
jgi:hypothetical protein